MFVISGIVAGEAKEGIVLRRMIRIVRILQMKRRMLQLMGIPQEISAVAHDSSIRKSVQSVVSPSYYPGFLPQGLSDSIKRWINAASSFSS
jgi:hypothetical protein